MMRSLFWPGRMLRGRRAARPAVRWRTREEQILLHFQEKSKAENDLLNTRPPGDYG
ncbi:hypothetical protein [Candidatus Electronema sp. TJ]|uniref:hypothetical protein n=1 Tax=Candidatus Electronema sp. TJ TaxID=3401573 RepID=UPI003AA85ACB